LRWSYPMPPKLIIQLGRFVWTTMWRVMMSKLAPRDTSGAYLRPESQFRDRIGSISYPAAVGRYKLFVGMSCPWAHRTLVTRALKGLESAIAIAIALSNPLSARVTKVRCAQGQLIPTNNL